MNQRAAVTLVDHVVDAVVDAVREELDELRAELAHVELVLHPDPALALRPARPDAVG